MLCEHAESKPALEFENRSPSSVRKLNCLNTEPKVNIVVFSLPLDVLTLLCFVCVKLLYDNNMTTVKERSA